MRFLNVFAYACGALALATGPVQPAAVEPDVAAPELDFEDAVLVSHGIAGKNEAATPDELTKRTVGYEWNDIPMATGKNPAKQVVAGITITYVVAKSYVQRNGHRVPEWNTVLMRFKNSARHARLVQAVVNGVTFFSKILRPGEEDSQMVPPNAQFYDLIVDPNHV